MKDSNSYYSSSFSNSITSKIPQFRDFADTNQRFHADVFAFTHIGYHICGKTCGNPQVLFPHIALNQRMPEGVYSLCAFILLPFSRFRGSCPHYNKVLAIPQTFLDTIAGSVWIVLFLSFLDYIYLAMSCLMPWLLEAGLSWP